MTGKDLTGKKFNLLTVIALGASKTKDRKWLCRCECGVVKEVWGTGLVAGTTKSCGCYAKNEMKLRFKTHGKTGTGAHNSWSKMRSRCLDPKHVYFDRYGGRGIKICERWNNFENFLADMGERPEGLTLERMDNDKGYEPTNCKWATRTEQQRNRRNAVLTTFNGQTLCTAEWAEIIGVTHSQLTTRFRSWPVDKALTTLGKERLKNPFYKPL